jgi:hypothetical protein
MLTMVRLQQKECFVAAEYKRMEEASIGQKEMEVNY